MARPTQILRKPRSILETETVSQVSAAVAELLDSSQRTPHMILRLGYPQRTVVRSRRLPLEAVTTTVQA